MVGKILHAAPLLSSIQCIHSTNLLLKTPDLPEKTFDHPKSATTPRVLTLKRSLACFEGIQRESPSYADARSIDMRMYTLQEVPKDLRAPSFRLERIGRTLSMTSLLEHIYISTFVDFYQN